MFFCFSLEGNFIDSSRNASYKHLMGLKWVTDRCGRSDNNNNKLPTFLLKTGDDVFIEIFHLEEFVNAIYGQNPK